MASLLALNNYFYRRGGAEVVFLEHMRLLEEAGWETVPFAMRHKLNLKSPWDRYFVDEIEFGESYSTLDRLKMASRVVYSLQARRRLAALLDDRGFDVAHAHNIYHHISPSVLAVLKKRGIPVLLTLHDLKLACPSYKMLTHDGICERCRGGRIHNVVVHRCMKDSRALSALILAETAVNRLLGSYSHNVSRFVVPSRFLIDKMVEWGWPRERFSLVPNFVDATQFDPMRAAGTRFVYIGRLMPEKGVATLIEAAARARVEITIVGTGPDEPRLRALAQSAGGAVQFLGYRSGQQLRDVIQDARAIVLPSQVYENAPISVLEAYAAGRPVIGARIGGIPELIREQETGASFASGDAGELAEVLAAFAGRSDASLIEMGQAGRRWVEQDFTPQRHRELLLAEYRKLGVRC